MDSQRSSAGAGEVHDEPPKRFFKVLMPGSEEKLWLPPKFCRLSVPPVPPKTARIHSPMDGTIWTVDLHREPPSDSLSRPRQFFFGGAGWPSFARAHGLGQGHFLIFNHLGDMVFDVGVYDHSGCAKFEAGYGEVEGGEDSSEGGVVTEDEPEEEEPAPVVLNTRGRVRGRQSLSKGPHRVNCRVAAPENPEELNTPRHGGTSFAGTVHSPLMLSPTATSLSVDFENAAEPTAASLGSGAGTAAVSTSRRGRRTRNISDEEWFEKTLPMTALKYGILIIPKAFVLGHDLHLYDRVRLSTDKGCWTVALRETQPGMWRLAKGFLAFSRANGLAVGDACQFKLLDLGDGVPQFHFQVKVDDAAGY